MAVGPAQWARGLTPPPPQASLRTPNTLKISSVSKLPGGYGKKPKDANRVFFPSPSFGSLKCFCLVDLTLHLTPLPAVPPSFSSLALHPPLSTPASSSHREGGGGVGGEVPPTPTLRDETQPRWSPPGLFSGLEATRSSRAFTDHFIKFTYW